ncbi:MAG: IS200/IS605 family transposase [Planctomycetes bacterium]|nr:IS200/IS605 family transposase [Planctomycetota bacterium]
MSSHVFHEIYLHINWHTKADRPTLNPDIELLVHRFIKDRCRKAKGVYFHGIGGTATHIHLAINIEPHVSISQLIQDLKGGSSHDLNSQLGRKELYWQRGYGVVSFGKNNLDWVLGYIAGQKEHHKTGLAQDRLERATAVEEESGEDV